ncbi:MAG: dihydrofolate reductase [bacterium]|nr:dihydrofolate reductase [bacterium]
MNLSLIAAVSQNGVIGKDNKLPWHIPEDLKRFKELTLGHCIIMGRKTWESIGSKPLPKRTNIIVTRQQDFLAPGAVVVSNLDEALQSCGDDTEPFVIGGAQLFAEALPQAQMMYLTRVNRFVEGDTFFPEYKAEDWEEVEGDEHEEFSFITYRRKT